MAVTTYYLRNTASDLSGGADFSYKLLTSTAAGAALTPSIAANSAEDSYAFTEPGVPGASGDISSVSVEINVTASSADIQLSVAVSRVNSSGTVQATSSFTAGQAASSTGVKTFTISSPGLGTWNSGDRLRITYRFRNTNAMSSAGAQITVNTTDAEVVVTTIGAYTLTADPASFTLSLGAATFLMGQYLAADPAAYSLSLGDADLVSGHQFGEASYSLSLSAASFSVGRRITAEPFYYSLRLGSIVRHWSLNPTSTPGAWTTTANPQPSQWTLGD